MMRSHLSKRTRSLLFCLLLAIVSFVPVSWGSELPVATPEEVGVSSSALARIGPAVETLISSNRMAGAVVMVARSGKIVFFEAYGRSDISSDRPMKRDEIMRIYSMTKPITSVAVMMLVEEGKISLDDPIAKYLPVFKDAQVFVRATDEGFVTEPVGREPTVRDLLRHTAGLTYGFLSHTPVDAAYLQAGVLDRNCTLAELTQKVAALPLLYQPGSRWHYSVSADVLARLVEVVSGQSFDVFLTERIFQPLDMHDTGFFVPPDKADRLGAVHGSYDGQLTVVEASATNPFLKRPGQLSGGGGLVSTARDYMRFCQMLTSGGALDGRRLLRPETIESMTTNQLPKEAFPISLGSLPIPGVGFGYGFSVQVRPSQMSAAHVGEYGWSGLASTSFWVSPKDDLVVIVLQQFMPFSMQLDQTLKPLIYKAIEK